MFSNPPLVVTKGLSPAAEMTARIKS
jgi:hypothetical protein